MVIRRFFVIFLFVLTIFNLFAVQFEFLNNSAKNISIGGSGISVFKDPSFTLLNPANLSLDKSLVSVYYEANSYLKIGTFFDLYERRFVFDPANVGVSFKFDDFSRVSLLFTSYLYDFDIPEITYKLFLFGFSRKIFPYLFIGGALGPVLGVNEYSLIPSFIVVLGSTLRFEDLVSTSLVFKSPFSVSYISPYYGSVYQTFPGVASLSGSFFIANNITVSLAIDVFLFNFLYAYSEYELFVLRNKVEDYISPKFGVIYYDSISGYRVMFGAYKSQIETLAESLSQYHLTFGATFFIRIYGFNEFEINFSLDDTSLLNFLYIAPRNLRKISLYVSGEVRF